MRLHLKDQTVRNDVLKDLAAASWPGHHVEIPKLHMLLIDDDPLFRKIVCKAAREEKIAVTECGSLQDLDAVAMPGVYDVAVIDYYLDGLKRQFKGVNAARRLGKTPVLLVSQRNDCVEDSGSWPHSIKQFINKASGIDKILSSALSLKGGAHAGTH